MSGIDIDSLVDIIFNLRWKSDTAYHTDCYQASRVNIWRDFFPPGLLDSFMGRESGERIEVRLKDGESMPGYDDKKIVHH